MMGFQAAYKSLQVHTDLFDDDLPVAYTFFRQDETVTILTHKQWDSNMLCHKRLTVSLCFVSGGMWRVARPCRPSVQKGQD